MNILTILAEAETQPLINISWWETFAVLANTLILFLLMKKFLFAKVNDMIEKRQNLIKSTIDQANDELKKGKDLAAEYENKIKEAEKDAGEIISAARKVAEQSGNEIINDAKKTAADTLKRTEMQIETEKKKALNESRDLIADLSLAAAEKIIGREVKGGDEKELIDEFLNSGDDHE